MERMHHELHAPGGPPDVNAPDARGMMALGLAVLGGHVDAVNLICEQKRMDVEGRDGYGNTALMTSARTGRMNICEQLLKAGADRKAKDPDGKTPMVLAMEAGHFVLARTLEHWSALEGRPIYRNDTLPRHE